MVRKEENITIITGKLCDYVYKIYHTYFQNNTATNR